VLTWALIGLAVVLLAWLIARTGGIGKWIIIVIAVVCFLTPAAMVLSLLYSQTGLRLAQGQFERLERFGIHIEGVSGRLAGPLYVERFELDNPRVHIVSHDLVIQPRVRQLIVQTIGVRTMSARDTVVAIRRAPASPPPTKPLRFLPSFLRVDIDYAQFTNLRYVNIDGTTIDARRASGGATLTSRHIRVPQFKADGTWFDLDGNLLLTAQRPLALALTTQARIHYRDIDYRIDGALDGTIDELRIKAIAHQPAQATATALLTRPNESWRIAGKVTSPEFFLTPWLKHPPFSMRDADLDVVVEPEGIQAKGQLVVPELDPQPLTIDALGHYAQRSIQVEHVDLRLANSRTRVRASGTVALDGADTSINARAQWSQLQWPLRGDAIVASSTGSGTLQGALPYIFSIDAQIAAANVPASGGTASGTISKTAVVLDAFDVAALNGRLAGSGSLAFAQPRTWRISATAADVDPGLLDSRFPGRLSARFVAKGTGLDKKARFAASIEDLRGRLREQPVRGNGGVERNARGWKVGNAMVDYGSAKLALNGELYDNVQATWSLQAPSLAALHPDATGALVFTGSANGPIESARIVLDARGERVGYQGWRAQLLAISGDVDLGGKTQSRLSIEAQEIGAGQAASSLIDSLRASGDGTADNHRITLDVVGHAANPSAPASRANVIIDGRYADAAWNATIHSTEIKVGDEEERLALVEPGQLIVNRERASLDPLCFAMGNGRLCAEGKWQRNGPWDATVSGYELPLAAMLPPSGPDTQYAGRIEGRVRAFGAPNVVWQGEAGMRIVDAAIIYQPQGAEPETLNLGTGGLGATATPERINFSFGVQAFTDTFLFANADIDRRTTNTLLHAPLVGDFRARAADANILPIVFPDIDNAAGLLTANGKVRGTVSEPQIDGRIELANGEFDSYRVNLALRDLNIVANLAGNALYFNGSGRAGEGELNVGGTFEWVDGVSHGNMQLRGKDLLVADLAEYRVVASPDLTFVIDGRTISASGHVTIPTARVQPADLSGAVQASDDARYVGEHPAEADGRYVVNSDVTINMGDDVRVESFGLQGRIVGGVATIIRTGETPIGRGELSVADGRYEAYGQELEIARGKLLFEASPLSDPALDIEARRKVETIVVGLNVRGTLQQPRLSFFSEPSMPQTQIVSYLLVGKPLDNMQSSDAASVNSARNALAMQGGGLLASQIGRRIGLEEVGVESTINSAGETNQQLVLGKFLSPRLFVSYGISLTESINTLKLRYTISDRWVLKTEAGENQSADIEFNVER
jgi:translocation and assembly module TamB